MRTDDIGAIERIIDNKIPVEMSVGTVYSVQPLIATIVTANRQLQECTYDSNISITAGDTVIMMRPVGTTIWHIVTVYNSRKKGISDFSRTDTDEGIGAQNARAVVNTAITVSVNATSWTTVDAIFMNFSGKRAVCVVNLFASGNSTAIRLYLGIQLDDGATDQMARIYLPTTNQSGVNFAYVSRYQLYGNHKVALMAQLSNAYATNLSIYQFAVYEI